MDERWRSVVGWKGFYEVSDQGRVRRIAKTITIRCPKKGVHMRHWPGRLMTPSTISGGYLAVKLRADGSRSRTMPIHRAVLLAFAGPPMPGHVACHSDGNPQNNALTNLRWDTHVGNHADRKRHGNNPVGVRNGRSKLMPADVRSIRNLASLGATQRSLAQRFGVSRKNIGLILRGVTWTHV